jgi:hypothetical protein
VDQNVEQKGRGKVPVLNIVPRHEDVCVSKVIAPRILNLKFGTRWRWVVSFTPRSLYLGGKSPVFLG